MTYINHLGTYGIDHAIVAMRNPHESWEKGDTEEGYGDGVIGERDLALAKSLVKSGSEHAKFLRQITVYMDICMPRYWWQEYDQYKYHVTQSTSTMHTLFNRKEPISLSQFIYNPSEFFIMEKIVTELNRMREVWLVAKEEKNAEMQNEMLVSAKRILPEGFLQLRTVSTNYAELLNIYFQRKGHRLPEWKLFCDYVEQLPYMKDFIEAKKGE